MIGGTGGVPRANDAADTAWFRIVLEQKILRSVGVEQDDSAGINEDTTGCERLEGAGGFAGAENIYRSSAYGVIELG